MEHTEKLHIIQLTRIRNLTPNQAVEWIKQQYPEAHISRATYFILRKELELTSSNRLFKDGQQFPQTFTEVKDTIKDLQSKSYNLYDLAVADGDFKSAQFIVNSIRDLQIWRLNLEESTKGVIEVHAKPEHSPSNPTKDKGSTITVQQQ